MHLSLMAITRMCGAGAPRAVRPTWAVKKQSLHQGVNSRFMACALPSKAQASVFLSHAGEQKKVFVDFLHGLLTEDPPGLLVFLDEYSLIPGTPDSWHSIVDALKVAAVGAAQLCSKCPKSACPAAIASLAKNCCNVDRGWAVPLPRTGRWSRPG